ncbi:hypothetical protein EVAR_19987_1 [Eumeta japonica]|uniref:Uncharacterized protein n=1 Tax=Eumeta variegata TaxID=151549 RepID=A0A4C1VB16_EUMVA|nr:hypothetical protein EVAR_19987_1 [Eumeta japonica]
MIEAKSTLYLSVKRKAYRQKTLQKETIVILPKARDINNAWRGIALIANGLLGQSSRGGRPRMSAALSLALDRSSITASSGDGPC